MNRNGVVDVAQDDKKHCQEGVKKGGESAEWSFDASEVVVTPEMLVSLRQELGMSLAEFGVTLRRAMDPGVEGGYSRQYVSRLEHGKDVITPELAAAFYNIAAVLDEVPAGLGGAVHVRILAQPGQLVDGAFVPRSARAVRCVRPGCNVLFVRVHPRQKYHDPECGDAWRKERRQNGTKG